MTNNERSAVAISHVASIELTITSIDALKAACRRLGLDFRENQKTYRWYGKFLNDYGGSDAAFNHGIDPKDYGKCLHAIGVPNDSQAYECGVVQKKDGTLGLVFDFWSGGYGLRDAIGENGNKLRQAYAVEVARRQLSKQGYHVSEKVGQDGKVQLVGRK